jgi:pyruvate dehydrogenase E2 component (dihydrolipoamide acetyltransferase)
VRVSPVARRLANELGVDLAAVHGTGPGGAIQRSDIERAAAAAAPVVPTESPPAAEPSMRLGGMREAIARAMSRSNREIPHYYLAQDIDMLRASQWLQEANRQRPVTQRLLMAALLIKATALALREAPVLNGFWGADGFQPSEAIHVGVAISLRHGGLMTPAIHHTDLLSLDELMPKLRDLVQRVRGGTLRGSEISDPTITVTNLGDTGVSEVFGVIYPPQVALVGFGAIADRPVAVDGLLGIRPVLTASLAADHRASDGVVGARFLNALSQFLQEPDTL